MIDIDNKSYKTKKEVRELIQNILNNNEIGVWLNEEDKNILLTLLKHHPDYSVKKGCGIKGFKIKNTQYKKRGFVLYRIDNSFTDFSYLKCINPPTLLNKIKQACRTSISQDILDFKIKKFGNKDMIKCEISNRNITFNNSHVDHHNPTFEEIFKLWFKSKNIVEEDLNKSIDNNETTFFVNKELSEDFRLFHNKLANLKITHPEINLKKGKKYAQTRL